MGTHGFLMARLSSLSSSPLDFTESYFSQNHNPTEYTMPFDCFQVRRRTWAEERIEPGLAHAGSHISLMELRGCFSIPREGSIKVQVAFVRELLGINQQFLSSWQTSLLMCCSRLLAL